MANQSRNGFTFVETLLVLVMLALIAGMIFPSFTSTFHSVEIKAAADDLASVMRYAQVQAVQRRVLYRLFFSTDGTEYRLRRLSSVGSFSDKDLHARDQEGSIEIDDSPETAELEFENIPDKWGRLFKVPSGIKVVVEKQQMDFNPDGTMAQQRITMSLKERSLTISSYELRGQILVFENES